MAFYRRILGLELPRISSHGVSAAIYEINVAQTRTIADVTSAFSLTPSEVTEFTTLNNSIVGNGGARAQRVAEIHFILLAAESTPWYNTEALLKARLGIA